MLNIIRKYIPKDLLNQYHRLLSLIAAYYYGWPSKKLKVIGVTGTTGKSTSVYIIAKTLESAGKKVGITSTLYFKIADKEWLNDKKMTMLGRFQTQKMLSDMVKAGCEYAVVETTSQGIDQYRHKHIHYDYLVFTNLYPEHIEAHGGFENYKKAKLKLFKHLEDISHKVINGNKVPKVIIANLDDEHAKDFLNYKVDKKIGYTLNNINNPDITKVLSVSEIKLTDHGSEFKVNNSYFKLNLFAKYNIYNSMPAIAVALVEGFTPEQINKGLQSITGIAGRLESIDQGQTYKIIVDYAFEPNAVTKLYELVKSWNLNKIIHVLGSTGGGRDVARRPKLGQLAGQNADYVIVTNEDPYDDDPQEIIDQVASGVLEAGKVLDQNLFKILDREEGIKKALELAQENDVVLITGKGAEQAMVVKGKLVPWDDRKVVKKLLG